MQVQNVPSNDDATTTPVQRSLALYQRIANDAQKTQLVMRDLSERVEAAIVHTTGNTADRPVAGASIRSALGRALGTLNAGRTGMVSLRCEMDAEISRLHELDRAEEYRASAAQELRDITIQLEAWRTALGAFNRLPDMGVEPQFAEGRDVIVRAIHRLEEQQARVRNTCAAYGVDLDALGLL